ncbi:hypothetical protein HDU98_001083 [Podochytrium sp. JEL0797]|nr:hypothetical protein HDU98_001083 [Podochytrium sp. JEL0797]
MKTSSMSKRISKLIYQYELTFGLYMLEPWEKTIWNCVFLLFFAFFTYRGICMMPDAQAYFVEKSRYYLSMESQ